MSPQPPPNATTGDFIRRLQEATTGGIEATGGEYMTALQNEATARLLADTGIVQQPARSFCVRLAFLILTCCGSVGIYFGYNMIGATTPALQAPPYNMEATAIGSLAAAYSFPNVVFPLFGGMLMDKLGVRPASMLYSGILALGAFGFWASLSTDMDHTLRHASMMSSMVVFGVGGESTTVVQKAMLASWFKDSKDFPRLAFATGLTLTFGYTGIIINRWSVPAILLYGVPAAYLMSAIVCLASFLALVVASWIHKSNEHIEMRLPQSSKTSVAGTEPHSAEPQLSIPTIVQRLIEKARGLTQLPRTFFVLCAMLSISSPLFASFETFGPDVMVQVWEYDIATANEITSLAQVAGLVFMPCVSMAYDRCDSTGRGRICGASLGCIIFASSWLALVTVSPTLVPIDTPYLGTVGVALGASMFFGGTWPCVPLLVNESNVGTAFGLMTAWQNAALSIILVLDGKIRDATGSFAAMGMLLAFQGTTSALLGLVICRLWQPQHKRDCENSNSLHDQY